MLHYILLGLAVWILISVPITLLIARFMALANPPRLPDPSSQDRSESPLNSQAGNPRENQSETCSSTTSV